MASSTSLPGYEKLLSCPYDESHLIMSSRMPNHLVKCRKNHPDSENVICPFNSAHHIMENQINYHVVNCPDRATFDRFKYNFSDYNYETIDSQENDIKLPDAEHEQAKHQKFESETELQSEEVEMPPPSDDISRAYKYFRGVQNIRGKNHWEPNQASMFHKAANERRSILKSQKENVIASTKRKKSVNFKSEIDDCQYNRRHEIPFSELNDHLMVCPDRLVLPFNNIDNNEPAIVYRERDPSPPAPDQSFGILDNGYESENDAADSREPHRANKLKPIQLKCPFNTAHSVSVREIVSHSLLCPDRKFFDFDTFVQTHGSRTTQHNLLLQFFPEHKDHTVSE